MRIELPLMSTLMMAMMERTVANDMKTMEVIMHGISAYLVASLKYPQIKKKLIGMLMNQMSDTRQN